MWPKSSEVYSLTRLPFGAMNIGIVVSFIGVQCLRDSVCAEGTVGVVQIPSDFRFAVQGVQVRENRSIRRFDASQSRKMVFRVPTAQRDNSFDNLHRLVERNGGYLLWVVLVIAKQVHQRFMVDVRQLNVFARRRHERIPSSCFHRGIAQAFPQLPLALQACSS